MKNTVKKSPYQTFSTEPIKAPNPSKNGPKASASKGGDMRVKGGK